MPNENAIKIAYFSAKTSKEPDKEEDRKRWSDQLTCLNAPIVDLDRRTWLDVTDTTTKTLIGLYL